MSNDLIDLMHKSVCSYVKPDPINDLYPITTDHLLTVQRLITNESVKDVVVGNVEFITLTNPYKGRILSD